MEYATNPTVLRLHSRLLHITRNNQLTELFMVSPYYPEAPCIIRELTPSLVFFLGAAYHCIKREENSPLQTSLPHSGPSYEGLCYMIDVL
jgi:hypothetical protein